MARRYNLKFISNCYNIGEAFVLLVVYFCPALHRQPMNATSLEWIPLTQIKTDLVSALKFNACMYVWASSQNNLPRGYPSLSADRVDVTGNSLEGN